MYHFILALFTMAMPLYAAAAEIKLICEDKSDSAILFRRNSPTLGIDIFAVNSEKQTVKQLAGELSEKSVFSVKFTEADISFEQAGYINDPKLVETFRTTISRVSGVWIRHPHYVNADGQWVAGDALEKLAKSLNLWGPFGIRQIPSAGECKIDNRKF